MKVVLKLSYYNLLTIFLRVSVNMTLTKKHGFYQNPTKRVILCVFVSLYIYIYIYKGIKESTLTEWGNFCFVFLNHSFIFRTH